MKLPEPASASHLSGLTPPQAQAAVQRGPVLVLAGAGTGKTKTLTAGVVDRIVSRGIDPKRLFVVTFTNKAAGEMGRRVTTALGGTKPYWLGTFHRLAGRMLKETPDIAALRRGFDILDAEDSGLVLKRVMKAMNVAAGGSGEAFREQVKIFQKRISWFKDNAILPEQADAVVNGLINAAAQDGRAIDATLLRDVTRVYAQYQLALREANAADFGDLLMYPVHMMRTSESYRSMWARQFDAILGDEYQDVNYVQYLLLQLLAADHHEIFCVGDDDQAIFSWRGSNVAFLRRFSEDYPNAKIVRLEDNFRSTEHILAGANAVIAKGRDRMGKTLRSVRGAGHKIEICGFFNDKDEAQSVVDEMRRRHAEGTAWSGMAVIYRSNAISRLFEEVLIRERVPHVVVGDVGFWARMEVKDTLALFRLADHGHDRRSDEAFRRMADSMMPGVGDKALAGIEASASARGCSLLMAIPHATLIGKAKKGATDFAEAIARAAALRRSTLADQISVVLETTGYRDHLRKSRAEGVDDRLENISELIIAAQDFDTPEALFEHASLSTMDDKDDVHDRVQLMTIHKSKGLEFPHVFLPAWEARLFPSPMAEDMEEERRLAYVALTRGMDRVTVSSAGFRRGSHDFASPFLDDIPEEHTQRGWLRNAAKFAAPRAANVVDFSDLLRRL